MRAQPTHSNFEMISNSFGASYAFTEVITTKPIIVERLKEFEQPVDLEEYDEILQDETLADQMFPPDYYLLVE